MKITINSLKELIRQSIREISFKDKAAFDKYDKEHKMRASTKVKIGDKETTVGQAIDVGGPSHANVPKKKKGGKPDSISASDWKKMDADEREYHTSGQYDKDAERDDTGKDDVPYSDDEEGAGGGDEDSIEDLLKQMDDEPDKPDRGDGPSDYELNKNQVEDTAKKIKDIKSGKLDWDMYANSKEEATEYLKGELKDQIARMKQSKNESIKESKGRRTTVKEVKMWMKTLEENRYKKTYQSDCRRVAWLVNNNLSEDYEAMPVSMKKKWPKAAYKRERFLAKEFVKHLMSKELTESKIRHLVRETIKDLMEGKKVEILIPEKDLKTTIKILKQLKLKSDKDYEIGLNVGMKGIFPLELDKKHYNKVLELLMKKRIDVQG